MATIFAMSTGLMSAVLFPSILISPVHLVCSLDMHFIMVDLPHPFGPISPMSFPLGMENDTL